MVVEPMMRENLSYREDTRQLEIPDYKSVIYSDCFECDNYYVVMENFFALLKGELFYLQEFNSIEHFKRVPIVYLDDYNNLRIKTKLKGLPPAFHRQHALFSA